MKLWQLGIAAILVSSSPALRAQDADIEWLPDYREALRFARALHKPLFVEFRCEA
jgi:hypothetical protein